MKKLLIRADASVAMGTGHVMRMIALAEAWQEMGGEVDFLCAEITPALQQRIRGEHFCIENLTAPPGSRDDLEATSAMISRTATAGRSLAVALDGYQFGADFQLGLKRAGCRLLTVDDYGHAGAYHADLVLNQNVSARDDLYINRAAHTQVLLGPKFALLRAEFLEGRARRMDIPARAKRVLVTLGGCDADNVTERVIGALARSGLDVKVAVGGSNPNMSSLRKAADAATDGQTRVELLVNSPSMPELMHWADLAVAAGGGTSWEIAYAGLPALFVILAENQEENARELEKQGFGICLGDHAPIDGCRLRAAVEGLANDAAMRAAFARRGRELVDGFGARRVAKLLYDNGDLELIRVTKADSGLLWEWANDPVTRANSFEPDLIPWDQHGSWLTARMHDLGCWFWLAEKPGFGKIGVIRFDRDGAEATVSICLAPHVRGRGLGSEIICAGCRRLFAESGVTVVRALIRTSNRASIGAFTRAGFQRDAVTLCKGHAAEQLLLHRPS